MVTRSDTLLFVAGISVVGLFACGCQQPDITRFQQATLITAEAGLAGGETQPPFDAQAARLRQGGVVRCDDPEAVTGVLEILQKYGEIWVNHWALPPDPPPVVLRFYRNQEWLGSLHVYDNRLGHVRNFILYNIPIEDTTAMVRSVIDCSRSDAAAR